MTTSIGNHYEAQAASELCSLGWLVLEQKYRSDRGEIDIIAIKEGILWFVEVRYRKNGQCWESITVAKQKRIVYTAQQWLMENDIAYSEIDFVVCAVGRHGMGLDWLENAFDGDI